MSPISTNPVDHDRSPDLRARTDPDWAEAVRRATEATEAHGSDCEVDRTPALSVMIVSYRTRDLTLRCVESVLQELADLPAEILVGDNGSADGTVEALEGLHPSCQVFDHGENLGFGRAQNRLARVAKGRYLLILNPDARLHPGCLQAMFSWLESHPGTAMVGPRTLYPDGRHQRTAFRFPGPWSEFLTATSLGPLLGAIPGLRNLLGGRRKRSGEVDYLQGSCLLCTREAFLAVGGFDESFFLFSEEVDLQRRMADSGAHCAYVAEALLTHEHGKSMEQAPVRNYVELYRAKDSYFVRHASPVGRFLIRRMWGFFHLTRWLGLAVLAGITGSARFAEKSRKHRAVLSLLRGREPHDLIEREES